MSDPSIPPPHAGTKTQCIPSRNLHLTIMSNHQGAPPTYETATGGKPVYGEPLGMTRSNDSSSTIDTLDLSNSGLDRETLQDLDDEQRDLPEGWVRCFDPKQQHHFYVEEATKRAIWVHPYDDPEFLQSLPDTHPANPNSKQGKAARKQSEDELLALKKREEERKARKAAKGKGGNAEGSSAAAAGTSGHADHDRNWIQRQKDKAIGTKEEREQKKEAKRKLKAEQERKLREQQQAYLERRRKLLEQQRNDPTICKSDLLVLGSEM